MILRLKKLMNLLRFYSKANKPAKEIPLKIELEERIARSVYSPINLHRKKKTLLSNTFRTPSGIDEVSVNRLDLTSADFCKKVSKKNEHKGVRSYFGFAILNHHEILSAVCKLVYTPILKPKEDFNPFHSDIKVGFTPVKGEPLPAEIAQKIDILTQRARFYLDNNPDSERWTGDQLA